MDTASGLLPYLGTGGLIVGAEVCQVLKLVGKEATPTIAAKKRMLHGRTIPVHMKKLGLRFSGSSPPPCYFRGLCGPSSRNVHKVILVGDRHGPYPLNSSAKSLEYLRLDNARRQESSLSHKQDDEDGYFIKQKTAFLFALDVDARQPSHGILCLF